MDVRMIYNLVRTTAQAKVNGDQCYSNLKALVDSMINQYPSTCPNAQKAVQHLVDNGDLFNDSVWSKVLDQAY